MSTTNVIPTRDGQKASAVCEWCDRKSQPVRRDYRGEPDLFELPRGWSQAPYSSEFMHDDGSTGSLWTCPACNKHRVGLRPHPDRSLAREGRRLTDGTSVQIGSHDR
jgi:hypothetical protein